MVKNYPTKFNTCIIVITYNPDNDFTHNLEVYQKIVNKIIVIDNNSIVNIDSLVPQSEKFEVVKSQTNNGIAWALNQGITRAKSQQYKWVLTFDQDSTPSQDILNFYSQVLMQEVNVGLLGTKFSVEKFTLNEISWNRSLTLITSGTLHPIEIFDEVGYYNEKLFIDAVDFDFVLRVKNCGYNVIRVNQSLLMHKLGSPIRRFGLISSNHNLLRRYYYSRNHIYLTRTYFFKFPLWILKKNFYFIKSIVVLVLVEDSILAKIRIMHKGIVDGFKNF